MSLVSGDDRSRRVGPQVFADVPSAGEIKAVRRSRNWIAILLVLVLGALALSVAGLLYFARQASEVPQLRIDHQAELDNKQREIETLNAQINSYEGFDDIARLRARAKTHRDAIETRLGEVAVPDNLLRNSWFSRERGTGRWPALRDDLERGLREEIDGTPTLTGLAETERRVREYRPPAAARPAPLPVNP